MNHLSSALTWSRDSPERWGYIVFFQLNQLPKSLTWFMTWDFQPTSARRSCSTWGVEPPTPVKCKPRCSMEIWGMQRWVEFFFKRSTNNAIFTSNEKVSIMFDVHFFPWQLLGNCQLLGFGDESCNKMPDVPCRKWFSTRFNLISKIRYSNPMRIAASCLLRWPGVFVLIFERDMHCLYTEGILSEIHSPQCNGSGGMPSTVRRKILKLPVICWIMYCLMVASCRATYIHQPEPRSFKGRLPDPKLIFPRPGGILPQA